MSRSSSLQSGATGAAEGWSTQQLAEFVAAVSAAEDQTDAAVRAVERAAETLDADVAAIVGSGEVVAAVGYPEGRAPVATLAAVRPGAEGMCIEVPGVGACAAAAATLRFPNDSTLVVARPGNALSRQEIGLLRGMARVASLTMSVLCARDEERAWRERIEDLAREQASLRRVATLVAEAASPDEIFSAVAEEVALLADADIVKVLRYEPGRTATVVGGWGDPGLYLPIGARMAVAGGGVANYVYESLRPARSVRAWGPAGSVADAFRRAGATVASGSPILVQGRLWGVVIAALTPSPAGTSDPRALPPAAEARILAFTELVATAIANAEGREQLRAVADEQAALRRVATLVARDAPPAEVFAAVAAEVARLVPEADVTCVGRYDAGGAMEYVGGWSASGEAGFVGRCLPLGGRNVATIVSETGGPARVDDLVEDGASLTAFVRTWGLASAGAPVRVGDRLWGFVGVQSPQPNALPARVEHRLADFTELVATAVASAESRAELETSRAQSRRTAAEHAALRRVATLVARGVAPVEIFEAVVVETRRVLGVDAAVLTRLESDGAATVIAADSAVPLIVRIGERMPPQEGTTIAEVVRTGAPARTESDGFADGPMAAQRRAMGCTVGAPVTVEGRLWGVMIGAWSEGRTIPDGAEERLMQFTELVATAVANAQSRADLMASRARVVEAADEARRKIERDLHDGVQQRLIALGLKVREIEEMVDGSGELGPHLEQLAGGLASTFGELREISTGIHPAILVRGGLRAGIRSLARRSPVPVEVTMPDATPLPERVEVAAYYVASEALTNVAKHAHASRVEITAAASDGVLELTVRDDGVGGATSNGGTGLIGLRDRVEALGGRLRIRSRPNAGTTLQATLPLAAPKSPSPQG